jgi:hypothetical protein
MQGGFLLGRRVGICDDGRSGLAEGAPNVAIASPLRSLFHPATRKTGKAATRL